MLSFHEEKPRFSRNKWISSSGPPGQVSSSPLTQRQTTETNNPSQKKTAVFSKPLYHLMSSPHSKGKRRVSQFILPSSRCLSETALAKSSKIKAVKSWTLCKILGIWKPWPVDATKAILLHWCWSEEAAVGILFGKFHIWHLKPLFNSIHLYFYGVCYNRNRPGALQKPWSWQSSRAACGSFILMLWLHLAWESKF